MKRLLLLLGLVLISTCSFAQNECGSLGYNSWVYGKTRDSSGVTHQTVCLDNSGNLVFSRAVTFANNSLFNGTFAPSTDIPAIIAKAFGGSSDLVQGQDSSGVKQWYFDSSNFLNIRGINTISASPFKLDFTRGLTCTISTISRTANVTTVICATGHGFSSTATSQYVDTSGVSDGTFNGNGFGPITVTNATTFTYPQTAGNASSSGGSSVNTCSPTGIADHAVYCYDYASKRVTITQDAGPKFSLWSGCQTAGQCMYFPVFGGSLPVSTAGASMGINSANVAWAAQFALEKAVFVKSGSIVITAIQTGTCNADIGIYSSNSDGSINAPLVRMSDASKIDCNAGLNTVTTKTFTTGVTLQPGTYWMLWCTDVATDTFTIASVSIGGAVQLMSDVGTVRFGSTATGCTAGALPASPGVVSALSNAARVIPVWGLSNQ